MGKKKSILQERDGCCYLCGQRKPYLEEHHIFGGPNRRLSEEYGLKVYLCPECHRTGAGAIHNNPAGEENRFLQKQGQRAFAKEYPERDFRKIFGKNYI